MPEQPSASVADSCNIHDFDELLSLDDIFVEYFNEFLSLGPFIQKVEYNRELNAFVEKKQNYNLNLNLIDDDQLHLAHSKIENDIDNSSIHSGFTDFIQLDDAPDETNRINPRLQKARQIQMAEWVKNERLGLFWRTELYRQYKLCKLLLRPLTVEKEASEYSSQCVGGYSRQSIYTAAHTLSTDNSNGNGVAPTGTLQEDEDQIDSDQIDSYNNNMIFENGIAATEFLRMPRSFLRPGSRAYSVPANMVSSLSIFFPNTQVKYPTKMSKRSTSSKTSQRKSLPKDEENTSSIDPNDPRNISMYNSARVKYSEDAGNEEESDDMGELGIQIQSSSNQLKYKYLGSFKGMQAFVRFLQTTKGGNDLYRFWMDCEFFKDTMAGLDQVENVVARTRLFRDLNDGKYHLPFMRHLQNKIRRTYAETAGVVTHDVFLQVQYDVLRRLRVYWSARFIIHELFKERHSSLAVPLDSKQPANVCLYPVDNRTQANLVEMTRIFISDDYTTNENKISEDTEVQDIIEQSFNTNLMKKYATIIRQDKHAGGLFLRHVTYKERRLLPLMLFCYDIDDFRHSNMDDKVLESQHGLSILNTYFGNSAKLSLDQFMPDIKIQQWIEAFQQYKFDKLSFEPLFKRALLILKDSWLRCLKEDVDHFTTAYYVALSASHEIDDSENEISSETENDGEDSDILEENTDDNVNDGQHTVKQSTGTTKSKTKTQRSRSPSTQIKVSNNIIYIKRPWLKRFIPSAPSERQERFREALENAMTDEERKRLRAEKLERLRRIEENRKKALRAAKERQKKKALDKDGADTVGSGKTAQSRRRDLGLYIDRVLPNKTAILSKEAQRLIVNNFQRYLRSRKSAAPKLENKLSLIIETAKWVELTNSFEKQQQVERMKKTYFDAASKRNVLPLNGEHAETLEKNGGRPDPSLLQTLYRDFRTEVETEFVRYCEERIQEFEIDSIEEFLSKSTDDLTLLFNEINDGSAVGHDDDDANGLYDPDIEAIASNSDGTGKATKKHYSELFQIVSDAAIGRFNERFYYFYAYLTHWVDAKKAPYLDHDFLFCIDVSRLREIANESMLQAKLRYILETYLEGSTASNTIACRLDISNTDVQMRMLRSLQKSLTANLNDFTPLDEARTSLLKDKLVSYYAGFKAYLFRMNLTKTHPSRLARLQEQLKAYQQQQQQRANKSAKTATRSSASTSKNNTKKSSSVLSKYPASTESFDITTVTKTQHILEERMSAFDKIQSNLVADITFPMNGKSTRRKVSANNKMRTKQNQNPPGHHGERAHSAKEKHRGPVFFQYSLTSGLKVKYGDSKGFDGNSHDLGDAFDQPRGSLAHSLGSGHD